MPRRNRQKWHRERRLAAEADKARRRERRLREQQEQADAIRRADTAVHTMSQGRSPREEADRQAILNLLSLAAVDQSVTRRVLRLHEAMSRVAPGHITCEDLPWLLMIARCPWVGAPETFRAPTRSLRRKRQAMVLHLLTAYPVPPFLVRALDVEPLAVARVPEEDEWAVRVLSHVGRGDSLRKIVGTRWLPAPLTRAMQHQFLSATADTPPILALRAAQVVGLGGPAGFAWRLCRTRLQSLRGPDPEVGESFWHRVIGWLARQPEAHTLDIEVLDRILAWFEHRQRASLHHGSPLRFKGRTMRTVRHSTERWWVETQRIEAATPFAPCGLLPFEDGPYAIREIRSLEELVQEGQVMHHCVATYEKLIQRGKVSIWSLRLGEHREATIEVALGAGKVVQIKQILNAEATEAQRDLVRRWAALNHLTVAA